MRNSDPMRPTVIEYLDFFNGRVDYKSRMSELQKNSIINMQNPETLKRYNKYDSLVIATNILSSFGFLLSDIALVKSLERLF